MRRAGHGWRMRATPEQMAGQLEPSTHPKGKSIYHCDQPPLALITPITRWRREYDEWEPVGEENPATRATDTATGPAAR
ncbi:hypothetical protein KCP76_20355 [Salmonella enterica subsp. enterica serovar Weltevreden]|nr:hypothetical protein KCP76_20355 [Salmonella enterica subsp. enterica serovar Weltevreden]